MEEDQKSDQEGTIQKRLASIEIPRRPGASKEQPIALDEDGTDSSKVTKVPKHETDPSQPNQSTEDRVVNQNMEPGTEVNASEQEAQVQPEKQTVDEETKEEDQEPQMDQEQLIAFKIRQLQELMTRIQAKKDQGNQGN